MEVTNLPSYNRVVKSDKFIFLPVPLPSKKVLLLTSICYLMGSPFAWSQAASSRMRVPDFSVTPTSDPSPESVEFGRNSDFNGQERFKVQKLCFTSERKSSGSLLWLCLPNLSCMFLSFYLGHDVPAAYSACLCSFCWSKSRYSEHSSLPFPSLNMVGRSFHYLFLISIGLRFFILYVMERLALWISMCLTYLVLY